MMRWFGSESSRISPTTRAAWFREWRMHRAWLIVAALLIMAGPVTNVVRVLGAAGGDPHQMMYWKVLLPALYNYNFQTGNGFPDIANFHVVSGTAIKQFEVLAAAILGGLVWGNDRSAGLTDALRSPLSRTDIARAKVLLPAVVIGLSWLGVGVLIAGVNAFNAAGTNGFSVPWYTIWTWWLTNLIAFAAGFSTGFLVGAVVGVFGVAFIFTFLSLFYPWIVGSFVDQVVAPRQLSVPVTSALTGLGGFVKALSPVTFGGTSMSITGTGASEIITWGSGTLLGPFGTLHWIWLCLWTALAWILAHRMFVRTPVEWQDHVFVAPALWRWAILFVSFPLAFMLIRASSPPHTWSGLPLFLAVCAGTGVLYVILRLAMKRYLSTQR